MHFAPREIDKLLIYTLAMVAQKRKDQGPKLNKPETVPLITVAALDGARAGQTVEQVMDGVVAIIPCVQVEAVFTDGSRLLTVHNPIQ